MMTSNITVSRFLLPALIAVVAIIAAVGAGIGSSSDNAEAVTSDLTIGLDMKTTTGAAGTYNINSLPALEQCVDVSTSVASGVFYIDIFILNAPAGFTGFTADHTFTTGAIQIMGSNINKFLGTSGNINNLTPYYNGSGGENNLTPVVNDGFFATGAIDISLSGHPGSGVLARIKAQPTSTTPNIVDFRFATSPTKGVTLTAEPPTPAHPGDTTGDGIFDGPFINAIGKIAINQPDGDGDTVSNACDNCPSNSNTSQTNTDRDFAGGDALGDACDTDDDADGVLDGSDNCPLVPNPTQDPAACQDSDGDTILDGLDNCPTTANGPAQAGVPGVGNQTNTDNDSQGDACDPDDDNDGVNDGPDNCDLIANPSQANWNGNALGDACEDSDGDNWLDAADNCKQIANQSQGNADTDTHGDICDNCPVKANQDQADAEPDGIGDACDDSDLDGWFDQVELFTGTNRTQKCSATGPPTPNSTNDEPIDASPPDTNDDKRYNTLDLVPYVSALNSIGPGLPYKVRLDFDMNNRVNTLDLIGYVAILNTVCTG